MKIKPDFLSLLQLEETLDPSDWNHQRQLAHRMVDDMFDFLQNIREEPCWKPIPPAVKAHLRQPLPQSASPVDEVYEDFKTNVLPYRKGSVHPRFWAFVEGTGTPFAMMAEMLASGMNSNLAIGDHSPVYVENQVLDWCKTMLGFPKSGSGILLSGGSMANITGIVIARNAYGERSVRKEGLKNQSGQLVLYVSTETHSCLQKAVEIAGLGSDALRRVRVNADYRMDTAHLRQLLAEDRAAGKLPFCIVGNAGTVNTGAIDPLDELLDLCRSENLWFHIDGAFGALAKLAPEFRDELLSLEHADSLALDLHKWMYMPYEVGCLLVKDPALHRSAFALQPSYLLTHERGLAGGPDPITNYGMELSRGFKALKVWMSFKEHGIEKFARLIRQNIAQAFYLESLVEQEPLLEMLAPVTMNIACFRFRPANAEGVDLNALNKEILMRLHEEGIASPSFTMLHGKYAIRVANVNHRSRKEDFEMLVREVVRIGKAIDYSGGLF